MLHCVVVGAQVMDPLHNAAPQQNPLNGTVLFIITCYLSCHIQTKIYDFVLKYYYIQNLSTHTSNLLTLELLFNFFKVYAPVLKDLEHAIEAVCNVDHRLHQLRQNLLNQGRIIPPFEVHGLNGFQKMLKCLLQCVSKPSTRETIYQDVENRCHILGLDVSPTSIQTLTANDINAAGARRGKADIVTHFVNMYEEEFAQMEDNLFLQTLADIGGLGEYPRFQMNLLGRQRFDFLPRDYNFRRKLRSFEEKFGIVGGVAAGTTPTRQQTIQKSQIWVPRRGVAAFLIWFAY